MENNPWQKVEQRLVYENPWITVTHHDVIRPDRQPGIYGVVHYRNLAVGVLPIDENGWTWLVGQYRFAIGQYSWEIPEGGCPEGESTLLAAQRELREDTGLVASDWCHIGSSYLSNSVTDEFATIFVARGISKGEPSPDATEILTLRHLPFDEAIGMVLTGQITDATSVMAILLYDRLNRLGTISRESAP